MNEFSISGRLIGYNHKPLIIAELGINHGGSLNSAFKIVDEAAAAGAEIIKHQTHIIDDEMSQEAKYVIPGNSNLSIYEIMERCALSEKDEIELKNYVEKKTLLIVSSHRCY